MAHRAGNSLAKVEEALTSGVDYLEADVWCYRSRLEVRHEKTAGPLPILWDRWYVKAGWGPRLSLDAVLAAVVGSGRLFADLKGSEPDLASSVAQAVDRAGAGERVAFSGGWDHLDQLKALLPQATCFFTVGSLRRLDALRPRLARGDVTAVAIDSRFLTAEIVVELRDSGVDTVLTWAVETADEARRLLQWGVGGITSDSLPLLVAIREGRIQAG